MVFGPDGHRRFLGSGRPWGPGKPCKNMGGFAPHNFEWFTAPPGPPRPPKSAISPAGSKVMYQKPKRMFAGLVVRAWILYGVPWRSAALVWLPRRGSRTLRRFIDTVRALIQKPLKVGAGSLSFCWLSRFLVVFLGFPAGSLVPLAYFRVCVSVACFC